MDNNLPWYNKLGFRTYNSFDLSYTLYVLRCRLQVYIDAYNPSIYTSNGCFVFCPVIVYELWNVGMNEVDSVTSTTSSIINRGVVDAAGVG